MLYSSFPPLPPNPSLKGEDDLSHLGRPPLAWGFQGGPLRVALCRALEGCFLFTT